MEERKGEKNYQQVIFSLFFRFSLFFTDVVAENLLCPRVSLSFLLFVLVFHSTLNFVTQFFEDLFYLRLRKFSRFFVFFPFRDVSIAVFRNYTEMKMSPHTPFPRCAPTFWGIVGRMRHFIKAKCGLERQSTIKKENGRAADTYRSVYKHNKSFFLRGLPGECARQGVAELGCVSHPSLRFPFIHVHLLAGS